MSFSLPRYIKRRPGDPYGQKRVGKVRELRALRSQGEPQIQIAQPLGGGKMRELNVRLIMCFALLFATTSGAGCSSQTPAAGCSGQGVSSPGQGPTNPTVNNVAELNGNYAFTF